LLETKLLKKNAESINVTAVAQCSTVTNVIYRFKRLLLATEFPSLWSIFHSVPMIKEIESPFNWQLPARNDQCEKVCLQLWVTESINGLNTHKHRPE